MPKFGRIISAVHIGIILMLCFSAVRAEESLTSRRMEAERLVRSGDSKRASQIYQELALHPDNSKISAANDLDQAIRLLRLQSKLRVLDAFREKAAATLSTNRFALEVLAYDYLYDPYHWGYLLDDKFQRGAGRLGNARPVCSFARDRARCLQLLAQALSLIKNKDKDNAYGAFCLKAADAILIHRGRPQPSLLESLTDLTNMPPFEEGHDLRYTVPETDSYSFPAQFEGYRVPASWDTATSDGERWRYLLDQASTYGKKRQALTDLGDFYRSILGVQRYSRVKPALMERFKSLCEQLTDGQSLTIGHNDIRVISLPEKMNYLEIYKKAEGKERLASVYAARGQLGKAAQFLSVRDKDDWERTECEFVDSGPILLTETPEVPLAYRNSGTITLNARPIDFDSLWRESRQYLESEPRYIDPAELGFANLASRLFRGSARALGAPFQSWTIDLPAARPYERMETALPLPFKTPGLYLLEGNSGDSRCRRVVHLTDIAVARKNLENGVWLQVVSMKTGRPIPNADIELLGYAKVFEKGRLQVRTKTLKRTSDDVGEVVLLGDELKEESGKTLHWAALISSGDHLAFLDFSPLPAQSPMERPSNVMRAHIMTDHTLYQPGDTVHYSAWLAVAGFAEAPEEALAANQKVKAIISGPDKQQVYSEKHVSDETGSLKGHYRLPKTAARGTYYLYIPEAASTISFTVAQLDEAVPDLKLSCEQTQVSPGTPISIALEVTEPHTFSHGFKVSVSAQMLAGEGASAQTVFEETYVIPPAKLADNSLNWRRSLSIPTLQHMNATYSIQAELAYQGAGYIRTRRVIANSSPGKVLFEMPANFLPAKTPIRLTLKPTLADGSAVNGKGRLEIIQMTGSAKSRKTDHIIHTREVVIRESPARPITLTALPAGRYKLRAIVFSDPKEEQETNPEAIGTPESTDKPVPVVPKQGPLPEAIYGEQELVIHQKGHVPAPTRDTLAMIPEKNQYSPNDVMRMLVISPVSDGTVAVFVRPAIAYHRPQFLTLNGASGIIEIPVKATDRPNMFVECLAIGNGRRYSAVQGITVLPGAKQITLKTDLPSHIQAGTQVVLPVSVEGVKNPKAVKLIASIRSTVESLVKEVPDIHTQLRPWVRRHQPWTKATTDRRYSNILRPGEDGMARLAFSFLRTQSKPTLPEEPMADTSPLLTPLINIERAPKTVYWKEVSLKDDGTAQIQFRAPESACTWDVTLWALSTELACGQWHGTFNTMTPIYAELSLPETATVGDRFQADILVTNTGEEDDFVALELNTPDGLEVTADIEKGFPLKPNESRLLDPVLIARKPGIRNLSLQLTSMRGEQSLRKKLQVIEHSKVIVNIKHRTLSCDDETQPLALPLNTTQVDWAVGFPGVMLQFLNTYSNDGMIIPEHLFMPVLVEAMALQAVKSANYSVTIDTKRLTEPGYWDKTALDTRAETLMLRLADMQNDDGGWSWSGSKDSPSDPETTATVIHSLQVARTYGLPISRASLFKAIQYLRGVRSQRLVALESKRERCSDIDATIYLALIESKDSNYAMTPFLERDFGNLTFVGKCRFVLGLRKIFYYDKIGPLMAELRETITGSEDQLLKWIDSDQPVIDTAEFVQVLNNAEPGSELSKAVIRWLITQRKSNSSWGGRTLDRLCTEAIASFVKQAEEDKPVIKVSKAAETPGNPLINVNESTAYGALFGSAAIAKSEKPISINVDGFGDFFAGVPIKTEQISGTETAISFAAEDGRTRGFVVGDIIDCSLTIKTDADLDRVALQCVLPAGLAPLTAGRQVICSGPMPVNQRDRNTITFMSRDLKKGEHTIHFRAVATYPGTFTWDSPQLLIDGHPIPHKKLRKGTCSIGRK